MLITSTSNPRDMNLVDRAADKANRALDATVGVAETVADKVSDRIETVRSKASPALDKVVAPFDSVVTFTHRNPLLALTGAVVAGAMLSSMFRSGRRVR